MFIDCASLMATSAPHAGHGVTVTDLDGDGVFEFLVSGFGMANRLLKWENRRLIDLVDPVLADAAAGTRCLIAADIDGDGREEVYACNGGSDDALAHPDRLFTPFGNRWLDLLGQLENAAVAEQAAGCAAACLDRLGRGRYGFAVAQDGEPLVFYELEAHGRLVDRAEEAGLDLTTHSPALIALPLISDRMDLFVHNSHGGNLLFRNLGDGTFEEVAESRGVSDPRQRGRGIAVLDADGNGLLDLVCAVWHGSHRLFLQRAGGGFAEDAPGEMSLPSQACSVIAADFDNDGYEELLFLNHGQPNRLFALRHDVWTEIDVGDAAEPRGHCTGAAVADIDGDGRLELLVNHADGTPHPLTFYKTAPNSHRWLRVLPLTPSGAPARGAHVICTSGGRSQHRIICAGGGYLSQMEPVAHFGLGSQTHIDHVEVRWPDGAAALIVAPTPGLTLTVPHPPGG